MTETRQELRAPVSLKVRFKSATVDQFIEQHSVNISPGGIFISSRNPLPVGTLIKFEFQLKDEAPIISGVGRVIWKRDPDTAQGPDSPPGMGVKFIRMSDESRLLVEKIVIGRGMTPAPIESDPPLAKGLIEGTASKPAPAMTLPGEDLDEGVTQARFFPKSELEETPSYSEENTQIRHASEFLASALASAEEDTAREAEARALQARRRTDEIELERVRQAMQEKEKEKEQIRQRVATAPLVSGLPMPPAAQPPTAPGLKAKPATQTPAMDLQKRTLLGVSSPLGVVAGGAAGSNGMTGALPGRTLYAYGKRDNDPIPEEKSDVPPRRLVMPTQIIESDDDHPKQADPHAGEPPATGLLQAPPVDMPTYRPGLSDPEALLLEEEDAITSELALSEIENKIEPSGTQNSIKPKDVTDITARSSRVSLPPPPNLFATVQPSDISDEATPSGPVRVQLPPIGVSKKAATHDSARTWKILSLVLGIALVTLGSWTAYERVMKQSQPVKSKVAVAVQAPPTPPVPVALPEPEPKLVEIAVESSPPGATFSVDGQSQGTTPTSLSLAVGKSVQLQWTLAGHAPVTQTLTPGESNLPVKVELVPLPFVITVQTDPPGAVVLIDNFKGVSPFTQTLTQKPTAPVVVRAVQEGYRSIRIDMPMDDFIEENGMMVHLFDLKMSKRRGGGRDEDAPAPATPGAVTPAAAAPAAESPKPTPPPPEPPKEPAPTPTP